MQAFSHVGYIQTRFGSAGTVACSSAAEVCVRAYVWKVKVFIVKLMKEESVKVCSHNHTCLRRKQGIHQVAVVNCIGPYY